MARDDGDGLLQLEEGEFVDPYRTRGRHLLLDETGDQAKTAGWIPPESEPIVTERLARIRSRRKDLHQSMEYVEFVAATPVSTKRWPEAIEAALLRLRTALETHVREAEAPDGLLAQIVDETPRLTTRVTEVEDEHAELLASVERVLLSLDHNGPFDVKAVRERVVSLLGALAMHLGHGADLMYDAYSVDIAAAD